ncbi:hypothetical protein [Actinokineospora iranica]|uniref:hypothetical protein n=1 Tax=Actinokineospora iranica TaxID=1271860 RepID=UPI00111467D2|nr:hypothetical protein [Actinokineospora iranica]
MATAAMTAAAMTAVAVIGQRAEPVAGGDTAAVAAVSPPSGAAAVLPVNRSDPLLTGKFAVGGRARVAKLGSDLPLAKGGLFTANLAEGSVAGEVAVSGTLDLPPAPGYFVVFGFMPVTATSVLTQEGAATGVADIRDGLLNPDLDLTLHIRLALTDVRQDGVDLRVGPDCRTVAPLVIRLRGPIAMAPESPPSVFESVFDIPPFTGCGTAEDLSPLMTGLISGPGNRMTTELVFQGF